MKRHVAVAVVMGVKQGELLIAIRGAVGVVTVEKDLGLTGLLLNEFFVVYMPREGLLLCYLTYWNIRTYIPNINKLSLFL